MFETPDYKAWYSYQETGKDFLIKGCSPISGKKFSVINDFNDGSKFSMEKSKIFRTSFNATYSRKRSKSQLFLDLVYSGESWVSIRSNQNSFSDFSLSLMKN